MEEELLHALPVEWSWSCFFLNYLFSNISSASRGLGKQPNYNSGNW